MASRTLPSAATAADHADHSNDVRLLGRLAAPSEARELPSGDVIVTFRIVVEREAPTTPRGQRVDTIDCTAWRADVRRTVSRWRAGDVVDVTGALRRRFWRGAGGPASRCEVEVLRAKRVRPAT